MISLINPYTGTETIIADERKDEYLGAGYKLASDAQKQIEEPVKTKAVRKKATPKKK